jgi:hypothetical protein
MTLLRAAFETEDSNVVLFVILCSGCLKDVVAHGRARHWTSPLRFSQGACEFCMDEVRQAI